MPNPFNAMKPYKLIPHFVITIAMLSGESWAQDSVFDTWATNNVGPTTNLMDVAFGNGVFLAVGGLPPIFGGPITPSLLVSSNGAAWTSLVLPTNANFYGVSFVGSRFVATGDSGLIMSSPDGVSWTLQDSSLPNQTSDSYPLGGVAFGNGVFVAMNRLLGAYCLVSTNGANWTKTLVAPTNSFVEMDRVHFYNGLFIAGGIVNNGAILTSTSGTNWTVTPSPVSNTINDVAYGAGVWVAVGDLATIISSTNALTWRKANVPASLSSAHINLHGITYHDGTFISVGSAGKVITSQDGISWNIRNTPATNHDLNSIALGNGRMVTVGTHGTIWQSAPVLDLAVDLQPTGANLTFSCPSGLQCVVQTSIDLIHWTDLISIPVTQGIQTLVDTNTTISPARFYQAVTR